jgi:hypothetical protein
MPSDDLEPIFVKVGSSVEFRNVFDVFVCSFKLVPASHNHGFPEVYMQIQAIVLTLKQTSISRSLVHSLA